MEHVEGALRKLLNEIAEKQRYENHTLEIKAISSGGANYSSVLYTATITAVGKEDLQLFAKVAALSQESREAIPTGIYDIEYLVYNALAEKFKQIEDKCGFLIQDRLTFSKYYGYNLNVSEETIILEDLSAKGFVVYDRMKSVDWPYASKAVETLAKFHALSMAYGEQYPEECKKVSEQFDRFIPGFKSMVPAMKKFVDSAILETKLKNKRKLAIFLDDEVVYDYVHYTKPRRKPVLIHGDYRPSNLMHRVNEDGSVEVIPLDFQTVRLGCVVSDLMYFIFLSSDQEFRAQHYHQLVELYYQQLCRSLRALHCDPEKVYSRKLFETELKETLPYGLVCAVMLLPIITVQSEDAPDILEGNVADNMAKTKTSSLYPERLNGVVEDYAKWGII